MNSHTESLSVTQAVSGAQSQGVPPCVCEHVPLAPLSGDRQLQHLYVHC